MAEQTDIAGVIKNIQAEVTTIVRGEIELAKQELLPSAKSAGIGAGLFGAAGYLALSALAVLFSAVGFAWSIGFQSWFSLGIIPALCWGFLTTGVLLLVLAGIAALVGQARVKAANFKPEGTINQAQATVDAVKKAIGKGQDEVALLPLTGHSPAPKPPALP